MQCPIAPLRSGYKTEGPSHSFQGAISSHVNTSLVGVGNIIRFVAYIWLCTQFQIVHTPVVIELVQTEVMRYEGLKNKYGINAYISCTIRVVKRLSSSSSYDGQYLQNTQMLDLELSETQG